ncbi:MAG: cysteine synthase A [Clostridia bacterium]|nr:cysteine synthase A [Clostridia bacterium]MBR5902619.1 cysteine synthase A [Clostridia bacterium]
MAKIYDSVSQLIGRTPLLRVRNIEKEYALKAQLLVKLESFNPAGSAKDRVALNIINTAEKNGKIAPGGLIIEPTSGNTGIGLSAIAASRGYRACIVMPDTMSVERIRLMQAYGAEVVLSDGKLGMQGAIAEAERIAGANPGSLIAGQFVNPANPEAHYMSTGPEILEDTDGDIDILVAGVGTGGTLSGTAKYLKEHKPELKIVAVEPASSPLLSQGRAGAHGLQGIGANFVPEVLDRDIIDEIVPVTEAQAYECARLMGKREGVLVGISSGAALYAAVQLAQREENAGKTIVVVLPDTGERYLSIDLYSK